MGACTGVANSTFKKKIPSLKQISIGDNLICSVCTLEYNLQDRQPVMLCINQHNSCRSCVDRIISSSQPTCPFCRVNIDASLLTKNRILIQILQANRDKQTVIVSQENQVKVQTPQQKLQRILQQARKFNLQKIIYHIESGVDLSTIKQLHLWSCSLKEIIDLSLFLGLKTLDLHKNMICEIDHLQKLTELTFLNLGYNKICVIKNLDSLQKLQFLDLCHNNISKIQNISCCSQLTTLNLSNNSITIIENLYQLKRLYILYLKSNPINTTVNQGSIQALKYRGVILEVTDLSPDNPNKTSKVSKAFLSRYQFPTI